MKTNEILNVGTIKGRHEMPVTDYIFGEAIVDPFDFVGMGKVIRKWIKENLHLVATTHLVADTFGTDVSMDFVESEEEVKLYITGLTSVTISVIKEFKRYGVQFTIMHFNSATGEYVPQIV